MNFPNRNKMTAKDFFLNLGAMVGLYVTVVALLNLLFTVINYAFPKITNSYQYYSQSISLPVATLIIFFPIFILLSWILEKEYKHDSDKRNLAIRKWLSFITLFVAGGALAGDLVTIIYYFLDGQEMTAGFILKFVAVLIVSAMIFVYYISDIRGKTSGFSRKIWLVAASCLLLASIIWGFSVLGSPQNQRLLKYDEQKISNLTEINYQIENYWTEKSVLPDSLADLSGANEYFVAPTDPQNNSEYVYKKTGALSYEICATFNKASRGLENEKNIPAVSKGTSWNHPAGDYCFKETINPSLYSKTINR